MRDSEMMRFRRPPRRTTRTKPTRWRCRTRPRTVGPAAVRCRAWSALRETGARESARRDSPFEQIDLVGQHGAAIPEERDQQPESNSGLGNGNRNDKQREDLSVQTIVIPREGDQID